MSYRIPTPELEPDDWMLLRAGMYPPWRRVWADGHDVTDDVVLWPAHVLDLYALGWRPLVSLDGTFMK